MKHNYQHNDLKSSFGNTPESFFRDIEIPYKKSKEDAWAEIQQKFSSVPAPRIIFFKANRLTSGIAATIILLAAFFSLLRFYTTNIYCPAGQHLSHILPDGSSVEMNADSKLTYKPFWWRFERQVGFEGEAFFEVKKGSNFKIVSLLGHTQVLGTSFNIYSRENEYFVTCYTGQVMVTSLTSEEVILSPNYEARINPDGNIIVMKEAKAGISHSWINNRFIFTSRPFDLVLKEIERQYGLTVILQVNQDYFYTGYFSKNKPVEEVLDLVCKPFGLTFVRISEREYKIVQN
jgi:ferric-dicitrate binding protein FerR (iron transport regulator)